MKLITAMTDTELAQEHAQLTSAVPKAAGTPDYRKMKWRLEMIEVEQGHRRRDSKLVDSARGRR